jgi:DNA (cytosine-5)-methyltransferase 1
MRMRILMLKVIELFAGVGGFHLGLKKAKDFEVVWANQWEPSKKAQDAFECYKHHFDDNKIIISNKDIATVDLNEIPESQVLVGGFPCQDYSVARSLSGEQGIQGKKGVLFWEIMRLVNGLKPEPKYILLENVDRLLKSPSTQRGRDFAIMLASLSESGYDVEWRVINAAEYGCAQRRRRVFIFAYKRQSEYSNWLSSSTEDDVLLNTGFFASKFKVENHFKPKKSADGNLYGDESLDFEERITNLSDNFTCSFYNSGIMRNGKYFTREVIPVIKKPIALKEIISKEEVDRKYFITDETKSKFEDLRAAKSKERISKTGHKYTFSEGAMQYPDKLDLPARTMLTSEGTVNRSTHVVYDYLTGKDRILTPEECEKLNGFEPGWTNTGMSERMRYFCMGNALVVDLVTIMGTRISEIDKGEFKPLEKDNPSMKQLQLTI